jgi:hypothetical protein
MSPMTNGLLKAPTLSQTKFLMFQQLMMARFIQSMGFKILLDNLVS